MLWLMGVSGSGKSAIAHSIAHQFDQTRRLGCSFFFPDDLNHTQPAGTSAAEFVVRNIVTGLTNLIDQFKKSVVDKAMQRERRQTDSITRQFEELFRDPSANVQFVGPFLIVIDGLDKIPTGPSRTTLISILAKRLKELPPNFRFLVSSSPDHDIKEAFDKCLYKESLDLQSVDRQDIERDITLCVQTRLADRIGPGMITDAHVNDIVVHSENHFWYAAQACDYLLEDVAGETVLERWMHLSGQEDWDETLRISENYSALFAHIFRFTDKDPRLARYQLVVGRIMALFDPLDADGLIGLIPETQDKFPRALLDFLGPLFIGTFDPSTRLQPFHSSLRTFLTTQSRSNIYYVDQALQHHELTCTTLQLMSAQPAANGHASPDPTLNIQSHLQYSCRFWGHHLGETLYHQEIETELVTWAADHVLGQWLRFLNRLQKIAEAPASVDFMVAWNQVNKFHEASQS